jgi:hypothetical protein
VPPEPARHRHPGPSALAAAIAVRTSSRSGAVYPPKPASDKECPALTQPWPLVRLSASAGRVGRPARTLLYDVLIPAAGHEGCWPTLLAISCPRFRYTVLIIGLPVDTK